MYILDTPEVTTTALPQDKTELTDEKPEVTTKENDDNISQTTLTPVQNTIKELKDIKQSIKKSFFAFWKAFSFNFSTTFATFA